MACCSAARYAAWLAAQRPCRRRTNPRQRCACPTPTLELEESHGVAAAAAASSSAPAAPAVPSSPPSRPRQPSAACAKCAAASSSDRPEPYRFLVQGRHRHRPDHSDYVRSTVAA